MGCCESQVEIASKLHTPTKVGCKGKVEKERVIGKLGESTYSEEKPLDLRRKESEESEKNMSLSGSFLSQSSVSEKEKMLECLSVESSISYDNAVTVLQNLFKSSSESTQHPILDNSESSSCSKSRLSSAYGVLGSRIASELFQNDSSISRSDYFSKLASSSLLSTDCISKKLPENSSSENKTPKISVQNPKSRLLKSKLDVLPYHHRMKNTSKKNLNANQTALVKVKVDGCPVEISLGPRDDPVKTAHLFSVKNRFDMRQRNLLVKKLKSIQDYTYNR